MGTNVINSKNMRRRILRNKIKISQLFSPMHTKCNNSISWLSVAILIGLLASGILQTNAVPTDSSNRNAALHGQLDERRTLRDVPIMSTNVMSIVPKDYAFTETTLEQPQGHCLLDGVLVSETTVFCERQKQSCRAIQKTGYCCPDYKCDCEKDGKTYLNGDKLVDPKTPCTVCYCQGGEILCSSVTCFHRDDCTPKFIPGRCCPEYDNCPVSMNEKPTSANKTLKVTTIPNNVEPEPNTSFYPKITIKEITKPIEIRITDDNKLIAIHQMLKSSTTEATTVVSSSASTLTATTVASTSASTLLSMQDFHKSAQPTVALGGMVGQKASIGVNTESLKLSASIAYAKSQLPTTDFVQPSLAQDLSGNDSIKENITYEKPISSFASQELQRVESGLAIKSSKVNIKREYFVTTESLMRADSPTGGEKLNTSESLLVNFETLENHVNDTQKKEATETDPDTAGSDNIYRIILSTDGPQFTSSTEQNLSLEGSSSDIKIEISNSTHTLEQISRQTEGNDMKHNSFQTVNDWNNIRNSSISTETLSEDINENQMNTGTLAFVTSTVNSIHHIDEDDIAIPIESNPAYPSLPEDDFSLRDVNFPLTENDDVIDEEPRAFSSFGIHKTTNIIEGNNYSNLDDRGSGMYPVPNNSPLMSDIAVLNNSIEPKKVLFAIVQFMNSAEDTSDEPQILNTTDFQLKQFKRDFENETGSGEVLYNDTMDIFIGGMSSGSGSGEIVDKSVINNLLKFKATESTTPEQIKNSEFDLDIDEWGSTLEVNTRGGSNAPETTSGGNILSVLNNSTEEKTIENDNFDIGSIVDNVNDIQSMQRLYLHRVF